MKYYYDDPIIAAYMAREFGVKYTHGRPIKDKHDVEDYFSFFEYECDGYPECPNKEYIRPTEWINYDISNDSLDVFKPQVGDLYKWIGVGQVDIAIDRSIDYIRDRYSEIEIIQRQGKHFFMPIKEGV